MNIEAIIAGYTAGSLGIFVGYPLDSLKVLAQTGDNSFCSASFIRSMLSNNKHQNSPNFQDLIDKPNLISARLRSVVASLSQNQTTNQPKSFSSLYAGIGGPLLTSGIITSMNFFWYDTIRRVFYNKSLENRYSCANGSTSNMSKNDYLYHDSLQNVFRAALLSASMMSIITSPIIAIKTKQQVTQWSMKEAALDTLQTKGGIRNFYIGYAPHLLCEAFGRATYFTTYEFLKRNISKLNNNNNNNNSKTTTNEITLPQRMLCASITGMISWTSVFPLDVLRNKMYTQSVRNNSATAADVSAIQMAYRMWKLEGRWKPFFRGYFVTIARAGPVAAVSLPCYDLTLEWLQNL